MAKPRVQQRLPTVQQFKASTSSYPWDGWFCVVHHWHVTTSIPYLAVALFISDGSTVKNHETYTVDGSSSIDHESRRLSPNHAKQAIWPQNKKTTPEQEN